MIIYNFLLPSSGASGRHSVLHHTLVVAVAGISVGIKVPLLSVVGDQRLSGVQGEECGRRRDGGGRWFFGEKVLKDE